MSSRITRRLMMAALFVGGPLGGYLVNSDRGLLLGLAVSAIAVTWFLLDERRLF